MYVVLHRKNFDMECKETIRTVFPMKGAGNLQCIFLFNYCFLIKKMISLVLATLGLCCCLWALSSGGEQRLLIVLCESLTAVSLLLLRMSSTACLTACGVFLPQPGVELLTAVLAGGFVTPGPLGKSTSTRIVEKIASVTGSWRCMTVMCFGII